MSQSTPFLSNPVFDPIFLDIPFLDKILASSSTDVVAGLPTSIQHNADLAPPGTNGDYQPPSPPIPAVPTPPPPPALPTVLPPPPPPPPLPHIYHRINTIIQHHIAAAIEPHTVNGKKCYKCIWHNCPFITHSKPTALTHSRKHFGNPKFYACSCGARFACKDSAQRHCDTRHKSFECALCLKKFARKDSRLAHQRRCPSTHPA